jgi:hypothetical protein
VISQRRDVAGSIQPNFVYQSTSLDYYEPMEHWEMDENTNVDVFEETRGVFTSTYYTIMDTNG